MFPRDMMKNSFFGILAFLFFISIAPVVSAETTSAFVFSFKGDVKIVPVGSNIGVKCEKGMVVNPNDWIKTGPASEVTLSFDENADNVIKVQESSLIILKMDGYVKMQLLKGELYAILEDVKKDEVFRVMTPSVVAESTSAGWGVSGDGTYTKTVVIDGQAYVCGINKDGTPSEKKYQVGSGYQRKTALYKDPGAQEEAPQEVVSWFKEQVIAHHLEKEIYKKTKSENSAKVSGGDVIIADGEKVNIVDYIYKKRLENMSRAGTSAEGKSPSGGSETPDKSGQETKKTTKAV
ncbi:MAG: FecR domain-containing protein [Candidatus Omnitrophica bacterium]|nr:FecR domain-containing protein [Candidatus Omnitrophota bacterium]